MKKRDYCIGLDIGTSSTGYAMTDMKGQLLKHKKRSTFGTVLFDPANPASERRNKRAIRRRLDRKEQRIKLLQSLLADEIAKVDNVFFLRLNESFLHEDDKKYPNLYGTLPQSIWSDGTEETFPTIYHIRAALAHTDKQADIRYVYLAMHHAIKYRGHFLMEGEQLNNAVNISETIQSVLMQLTDEPFNYSLNDRDATVDQLCAALQEAGISKSRKAERIFDILGPDKKAEKAAKALASLLVGNSGSLKDLLLYEGENPAPKLSLNDDWDEDAYADALGSNADLFNQIVEIYRWQLFSSLRKNGETISQAMIHRYEKHHADLKQLKDWVHKYAPEKYDGFFRDVGEKTKNYCTYTGHYKRNKSLHGRKIEPCTQEQFYDALKKLLNDSRLTDEAKVAAKPMLDAITEDNGFLPLLRINLNGSIPNQLHAEELSMILDRQGRYYPSLAENKEKIMSICTFRLPYFIGPLNTSSPFQKWLIRDNSEKVTPWNIYDVVNKAETAEGFIANLTNKCTYLPAEDVLPLHALLYEEYLLLDELNRVRINGNLIRDHRLKERIIDGLFKVYKTVTIKRFIDWLKDNTAYGANGKDIEISGVHEEKKFAASLRTYIDFSTHGFIVDETTEDMIENLVLWSTIFENRAILREKITDAYPELNPRQVDYVCRRRYTGWGRLSRKLLDGISGDNRAENMTIIDIMRMTNSNFMQAINDKEYAFDKAIEREQGENVDGKITLDEVKALQGSPALKRGIWQAVKIVEELIQHQGHLPKAIYIENTREEDTAKKKPRKLDRIAALEKIYQDFDACEECRSNLKKCKRDGVKLSDRQYLYFLQDAKCLYSGKPLNFDTLEMYQVDHILPQSYIKDDSLDNRALVIQNENQRKSDDLLLADRIRASRKAEWLRLRKTGTMMSEKKFRNLTRSAVEERDALGFINRQLVETSQIIKHVITLFKAHYPEVNVRAINARLSSNMRDAFELYKLRELNNTHHAYDAFLACTIGTFTDTYLHWLGDDSVAASMAKSLWKQTDTSKSKNGVILGYFAKDQKDTDSGKVLRDHNEHIAYLKKVWGYRDHFIVKRLTQNNGSFFNETRYPAGSKEASLPLRANLPVEKYGGFSSIKPAYIAAISYRKGKKRVGTLVNVPIYLAKAIEKDPQVLIEHLEKQYAEVRVVRPKILLNQRIIYDGSELLLKSCSEAWNGKELYLPIPLVKLLYQMTQLAPCQWNFTEEKIDQFIAFLLEKLQAHYPIYSGILSRIQAVRTKLNALPLKEKVTFVIETQKIMQVSGMYAMYAKQLPELKMSDNQGRITNKAFDLNKVYLVEQSVTGFYERKIKLWNSEQL